MKEVFPGIYMIEEQGWTKIFKPPVNIYVIAGSDGLIFDAGYGNRAALRAFHCDLKRINRICRERNTVNCIRKILISHAHADHFSGMNRLARRYNLDAIITERMANILRNEKSYRKSYSYDERFDFKRRTSPGWLKRSMDNISYRLYSWSWGIDFFPEPMKTIAEECTFTINNDTWQVIYTPGHSDDHISLYNPLTGVLLCGDNVLRSKFTWLGPPRSDIDMYLKTLEKLLNLPGLKIILPAHGSIITNPCERINEIISYWKNRMTQLSACITGSGNKGASLHEIMLAIYPGSGRVKHEFVRGWITLILEKMVNEERIFFRNDRFYDYNG